MFIYIVTVRQRNLIKKGDLSWDGVFFNIPSLPQWKSKISVDFSPVIASKLSHSNSLCIKERSEFDILSKGLETLFIKKCLFCIVKFEFLQITHVWDEKIYL